MKSNKNQLPLQVVGKNAVYVMWFYLKDLITFTLDREF